jgi:TPR repeat protein
LTDYANPTVLGLLQHCEALQGRSEGDASTIFLSYAGEDFEYVELLRKNLAPSLDLLKRKGVALTIWEYADRRSGTQPGNHFPTAIAEAMWGCRAAIVVWSQDYVRSDYCYSMELPFLLWRWKHSNLRVFLVRVNATTVDGEAVSFPTFRGVSGSIDLLHIVDDRNPALMPLNDPSTTMMLERLWRSDPGATKERIARFVVSICDLLQRDHQGAAVSQADASTGSSTAALPWKPEARTQATNGVTPRVVSRRAVVAALLLAMCLAVGVYSGRAAWNRLTGADVALALCDAAATSPSDPAARRGQGGVLSDALDTRQIPNCEKAVSLAPGVTRYDFQLGRLYEKAERFNDAILAYKSAADGGNALAANNLGSMYRESPALFEGRSDDLGCSGKSACDNKAMSLFAKANDGENVIALFNAALMYQDRRGVSDRRDDLGCGSDADCDRHARDLLQRAAALGDLDSSVELARVYLNWMARSDKEAPGVMALAPCGSRFDCGASAVSTLREAAGQGKAEAQFLLGQVYENQSGVLGAPPPAGCATAADCARDAIEWYTKAASSNPEAAARLKVLSAAMH